jgi:hypothetical protein
MDKKKMYLPDYTSWVLTSKIYAICHPSVSMGKGWIDSAVDLNLFNNSKLF